MHVPEPVAALSTERLLTMTWLDGRADPGVHRTRRSRCATSRASCSAPGTCRSTTTASSTATRISATTRSARTRSINLLDFGCIRVFPPAFVEGVIDLYEALRAATATSRSRPMRPGVSRTSARVDRGAEPLGALRLRAADGGPGEAHPGADDRHLRPRGGGGVHRSCARLGGVKPPREFVLHGPRRDRARLRLHAPQGRDQLAPPVPRAHRRLRRGGGRQGAGEGAPRIGASAAGLSVARRAAGGPNSRAMRVLYSDRHELHQPKSFLLRGRVVGSPETAIRASSIASALREAGHRVGAPDDLGAAPREAVHTRGYLDFLASVWERWQALPGAGPEIIANIHPGRHMAHRPEGLVGEIGWHTADTACPIVAGTWEAAAGAANAAAHAAALVREGERVAYALCRPPGHHAYADMAGGFCYLNNTAIAAAALRRRFSRVAIVDIDVHHGNGTQGIFWSGLTSLPSRSTPIPPPITPGTPATPTSAGAAQGRDLTSTCPFRMEAAIRRCWRPSTARSNGSALSIPRPSSSRSGSMRTRTTARRAEGHDARFRRDRASRRPDRPADGAGAGGWLRHRRPAEERARLPCRLRGAVRLLSSAERARPRRWQAPPWRVSATRCGSPRRSPAEPKTRRRCMATCASAASAAQRAWPPICAARTSGSSSTRRIPSPTRCRSRRASPPRLPACPASCCCVPRGSGSPTTAGSRRTTSRGPRARSGRSAARLPHCRLGRSRAFRAAA